MDVLPPVLAFALAILAGVLSYLFRVTVANGRQIAVLEAIQKTKLRTLDKILLTLDEMKKDLEQVKINLARRDNQ